MKKMHLKRRINIKTKDKISFALVCTIVCTFLLFVSLKKEIEKLINTYVENDVESLSTYIITKTIDDNKEELKKKEYVKTINNSQNEILEIDYNAREINETLLLINKSILESIKNVNKMNISLFKSIYKIEKKNNALIYYIPFGIVKNNPLLTDIGPKIPLRIELSAGVKSNVNTEVLPYKINNSLLKITIEVELTYNLIMPFITKKISTNAQIPLVIKEVKGVVPNMYGGLLSSPSNILSTIE